MLWHASWQTAHACTQQLLIPTQTTITGEIITVLIIYITSCCSAGRGRLSPPVGESPWTGQSSCCPSALTGDQLVWAGCYNTSVIRLGKWRHLTQRQLRLKPQGPVCKLHCSHKQSHWKRDTQEDLWFVKSLDCQLLSWSVCVWSSPRIAEHKQSLMSKNCR